MSFSIAGFFAPFAIYAFILAVHLLWPTRSMEGYVRDPDTGELLRYRINGIWVALVSIGAWAGVGASGLLPWDFLWQVRWESLAGACTIGLVFTAWVVFRAPSTGQGLLKEVFLGRAENPQFFGGRVDAKMLMYLIGAVMLELNLLAFTAHHLELHGEAASPGVFVYLGLFTWFVFDYLSFERVHVYTYDIFAERMGFKLGWGCLTFYPYFYAVGLWGLAEKADPGTPLPLLIAYAAVFFVGWSFARGANMQKFVFKRDPKRVFLGLFKPEVVSDGERRLLCSGFWGVSRHVNYLGEILMATGLALALGYPASIWPWLYPLYYLVLLVPRERDDDARCARKYGELWERYRERVPRRIVPGLY